MHNLRLKPVLPLAAIFLAVVTVGCIPVPPEKVASPTFSPVEGTFSDSVEVTISGSTDGAAIRYTVDGSTPSSTNGTVYQDALSLTETTTVQAIAYKDGMDPSDVVSVTFVKLSADHSLTITNPSASGTFIEDEAATLSVACTVTATGAQVQSVAADLSQVGGSDAQVLTANGNQWTWSNSVTPTSQGEKTITFTAVDSTGATTTATATVTVAPPIGAPTIADATVTGVLILNEAASITVHCTATLAGGTVQSVTADLSSIGGNSAQTLSGSGSDWTWTGDVTPSSSGLQTITFTATGAGKTSNTTAATTVTSNPPGTLAGAWKGDVTHTVTVTWNGTAFPTESSTLSTTVTLSPQFQPDVLPICVGNSDQQVLLPAATLQNVNDQVVADLVESKSGTKFTITATVTSITRSATNYKIVLSTTLVGYSSPMSGSYSWRPTLGPDDQLVWAATALWWNSGRTIMQTDKSAGTLLRQ